MCHEGQIITVAVEEEYGHVEVVERLLDRLRRGVQELFELHRPIQFAGNFVHELDLIEPFFSVFKERTVLESDSHLQAEEMRNPEVLLMVCTLLRRPET